MGGRLEINCLVNRKPPLPQMFCRFTREKVMFFDGKPFGGEGATALKRVRKMPIFNGPAPLGEAGFL